MSTDVCEQIRRLAVAFDAFIDEVTVGEIIGQPERQGGSVELGPLPASGATGWSLRRYGARWTRLGAAAASVALLFGLVFALVWEGRDGADPVSTPTPPTMPIPTERAGSIPSTTLAESSVPTTTDPLDFATTERALPAWPDISASEPPATTSAYGMRLCDGGYGTKILRVDSPTDPASSYYGTLCVFVELTEPRADAVTACATLTDGFQYARCQRRTAETARAGGGTAVSAVAGEDQQRAIAAFPTATSSDQPAIFVADVTAATGGDSIAYRNDDVTVALGPSSSAAGRADASDICFTITLPGASAEGCVGRVLLATGLAYGAFQDGDGPIYLVGIVPDEVVQVIVNGATVAPDNNVWHLTISASGPAPQIRVESANGKAASTM
jgi:hypothetical protein